MSNVERAHAVMGNVWAVKLAKKYSSRNITIYHCHFITATINGDTISSILYYNAIIFCTTMMFWFALAPPIGQKEQELQCQHQSARNVLTIYSVQY